MNERLIELYKGVAVHATADHEHTAALELLSLVMAADGKLEDVEVSAIRDLSDDWRDDDFGFDHALHDAVRNAREAIESEQIIELIQSIDDRISSRVLRRALHSAAHTVADSDDEVAPLEQSILAEIAVRFS